MLPSLREVDLYSFQGLVKADGKALHGEQYRNWQRQPAAFEIDGHAPVRYCPLTFRTPCSLLVLRFACSWQRTHKDLDATTGSSGSGRH